MEIRLYIHPDGAVTFTTLMPDLLPVAYALNPSDLKVQAWLDRIHTKGILQGHDKHAIQPTTDLEDSN